MDEQGTGPGAIDYAPWQWPGSRLWMRGPERSVSGRYIAVLGGLETFGRFVARPFPDLLEEALGLRCLNLGAAHAGPEAYLADGALIGACGRAEATVISVTGAHALSNRFYKVHPRRNDRVICHEAALRALYPEIDFSQHSFVRHLLGDLERASPERFGEVRDELRRAWVVRMERLCERIGRDVVLLWMGDRGPGDPAESIHDGDPPFVTRAMLGALRGLVRGKVEAVGLPDGDDLAGRICGENEARAALRLPGPALHRQAAEELSVALRALLRSAAPAARSRTA